MAIFTKDRQFYKTFFRLMGFVALRNFIVYSVNLADTLMLGMYWEKSLAGAALGNQIQFLLQMIVNSIGEGLMVLAAQYWGTKRKEPIRRVVASALRYGAPIVLLFFAVCFFFPTQVLSLFNNEWDVLAEGSAYLRTLSISFPFFLITNILITSQRSVERVGIGMWISVSALVTNVALNILLIFGVGPFPRLGAQGAAIATVISRMVECAIALIYVLKIDKRLAMKLRDFFTTDKTLWKDYVRVSTPVVLSGASWGIAMAVQTAILGRMGSTAVSANAIATTLFQICSVIAYGAASASGIVTGTAVGQGDIVRVKQNTRTMQALFLIIGLLTSVAILLLRTPILNLYGNNPFGESMSKDTLALAGTFMYILSVTVIGTAYQVSCLTGIVRGGGNTKFVFYNDLIFMWGLVLPLSLLGSFVFHWPPVVIFIVLKSDQILKCAVAAVEVNSYRWVKKLTRPEV